MPSRKKKTKPNKVSIIGIKYWNLLGKNTKNKYIITRENVKTQQTLIGDFFKNCFANEVLNNVKFDYSFLKLITLIFLERCLEIKIFEAGFTISRPLNICFQQLINA